MGMINQNGGYFSGGFTTFDHDLLMIDGPETLLAMTQKAEFFWQLCRKNKLTKPMECNPIICVCVVYIHIYIYLFIYLLIFKHLSIHVYVLLIS